MSWGAKRFQGRAFLAPQTVIQMRSQRDYPGFRTFVLKQSLGLRCVSRHCSEGALWMGLLMVDLARIFCVL